MNRQYLTFVLSSLICLVLIFLALEQLGLHVEPYWIALPVLCLPLIMLVIRRFPAALIPPVFFMGAFKLQPAASNLDFRDPTFWVLCLLCGTILVHALFALGGIDQPSLGDRVRGQHEGIVTYLFFMGVIAFSYLHTLAPEYGFIELTRLLAIGSVLYFSPLFLVRSETDIRHLITSLLLLSVVLTGHRFLRIVHYSDMGPTEDVTQIGSAELIGMSILLLLLPPKSMCAHVRRPLLMLCIPWLVAGLTVSIARGPLVSFIFTLIASLLISKPGIGLLSRKVMVIGLVVLVIPSFLVSLSWVHNTAQAKVETKEAELAKLLEFSDPGGTAGERLQFYKQALEGFAEQPFVGWGLGSFSVYATGRDMSLYPHNFVLQVAMEQGLLGLAALVGFAGALVRALRKTIAATRGEWIFFLWIILFLLGDAMFSGDLDQRPLLLWCGMAFASWRILKLRLQEQQPVMNAFARDARLMIPRRFIARGQELYND
jgi:O-antigen ligase